MTGESARDEDTRGGTVIDETDIGATSTASVVHFTGEIDLTTVENFRTAIRAAEADGGDVLIDLRDATFIDSTGISALIGAAHHAAERTAQVTVVVTQPLMRRVFSMMQLDSMLVVEPPLTAAD